MFTHDTFQWHVQYLRLTVNSWVSGLRYDVRTVSGQLNKPLPYPLPPHHHFFITIKIFKLPGFGSQMGLILVSACLHLIEVSS